MMKTKSLFALTMLLIISVSCSEKEMGAKENTLTSNKIQTVKVVSPQHKSFTAEILITGTARPNQVVMLYAMESGVLTKITKDIGDKVKKGEVIAVLENPDLVHQQLKLKAEYKAKKANYERLKTVYKKSPAITTVSDLEKAESEYFSAKANLGAIDNRIDFLTVKAPFAGIITKRLLDKGSLLQNGLNNANPQGIVEIQDINPIRLTLPVPASNAVSVKKGMNVQVTFPELNSKVFTAKVSRTANALDQMSKTMQVEIDLGNTNGEIITGMYAKALLQMESRENILSLPIKAKVKYRNEDYILVVIDKKVRRVLIKIGLSDKDYFEILNKEITAETVVIVSGKRLVKNGQKVAVRN